MIDFRPRYDRLAGRLARAGLRADTARAAWLSAAVPLAAAAAAALASRPLPPAWVLVGGAALFPVALAWTLRRRAVVDAGRDLDRRHGLGDLLITAIEVDRRGPASALERRLLADAAVALAAVADTAAAAGGRETRRELETLVGLVLLGAGLVLLGPAGRSPIGPSRLPPIEVAAGADAGGGAGEPSFGGDSAGGRTAVGAQGSGPLGDLGASLADHPAAGGLAQALAAGDPSAAAREARALAARAPDVSRPGRLDMAAELGRAAGAAAATDAALAAALREAAQWLEAADADATSTGLEGLAAELERHAGAGQLPGSAPRPPEARIVQEPRGRLPTKAGPQPLPAGGGEAAVTTGMARERPSGRMSATGGSASGGGVPRAGVQQSAPDQLDVPWAWRTAVRRYFDRAPGLR